MDCVRACRTVELRGIPVCFPPNVTRELVAVSSSFLERLPMKEPNASCSCIELPDLNVGIRDVIWSTMLSYLAFQKRLQRPGGQVRIVHLSSGIFSVRLAYSAVWKLKKRLKVPEWSELRVTAFGEPADLCVNKEVVGRHKDRPAELSATCRSKTACGTCLYYNNFKAASASGDAAINPVDEPEIEDVVRRFRERKVCPYYGLLEQKKSADLILSTYGALKDTLLGLRSDEEALPLDESVILICDDSSAFEKTMESCFDVCITPLQIKKPLEELGSRRHFLFQFVKGACPRYEAFQTCCDIFSGILTALSEILRGDLGSAFDTPDARGSLLKQIELCKMSPSLCRKFIWALIGDACNTDDRSRLQRLESFVVLQKLFWVLMDPTVAGLIFTYDPINNPFRLWRIPDAFSGEPVKTDRDADHVNLCSLSPKPGILALRRKNLAGLLAYGMKAPISFVALGREMMLVFQLSQFYQMTDRKLFHGIFTRSPEPDAIALSGSFANRETEKYKRGLARALLEVMAEIPGQVLVVFPSRTYYESCLGVWMSMDLENKMGLHVVPQGPCCHFGEPSCWRCASGLNGLHEAGLSVVTCARTASLDGACGGFMAVIFICLPYQLFKEIRVEAKQQYLNELAPDAGKQWYSLDAASAIFTAFLKATSYATSPHGARILISLDLRVQEVMNYFPSTLRRAARTFITFKDGIAQLKEFVGGLNGQSDQILLPAVDNHIGKAPEHLQPYLTDAQQFTSKVRSVVQHFQTDGNVDLFAARLLEEANWKKICGHSSFVHCFLPWIINFKNFFLDLEHQKRWPAAVREIVQQAAVAYPEYIDGTELPEVVSESVLEGSSVMEESQ